MMTFIRCCLTIGLGVLVVGLLRLNDDAWIYAHIQESILPAILGPMFLVALLLTRRKKS